MISTNKNGIPMDNMMMVKAVLLTAEKAAVLAEQHIEVVNAPLPNTKIVMFPQGWTVDHPSKTAVRSADQMTISFK